MFIYQQRLSVFLQINHELHSVFSVLRWAVNLPARCRRRHPTWTCPQSETLGIGCEWGRVTSTGCFSNNFYPGYKKMQKTHGFGENEQMAGLPVDLQLYT